MGTEILYAHIDHIQGRKQTLRVHSENTADLCAQFCKKIGMESTGKLMGLLHDSGKGTPEFQNYLKSNDPSLRGRIPHSFCGTRYCWQTRGNGDASQMLTAELAAAAICAHHGGLPDVTGIDAEDHLHDRSWPDKGFHYREAMDAFFQDFPQEKVGKLFEKARKETERVCADLRIVCNNIPAAARKRAFYFLLGLVQRYLLSCLIDADRYDTFLFEARREAEQTRNLPELWAKLAENLEKHLQDFPCDKPIDRERQKISEQCYEFARSNTGIFRLSVPTGSGKTMASLRYAINCAKQNGKERIFYIAPYKSILDQNAEEIRKALKIQEDGVLLEHHSDVVLEDVHSGRAERYALLTQRWDAPLVLTTAVQFLNTLFDGHSACVRRMHSLAHSIIILDEFQAFPVKCTDMLNAALDFLAYTCGCSVVLCTATQPESEKIPVPILLGNPAQMTENLDQTFTAFRRTRAVDKTGDGPLSAEQMADFALEQLAICDNLLMIYNTKSAAKAVFASMKKRMELLPPEDRVPVFCLSTSQCPQHRMEIIRRIRETLRPEHPGGPRLICISTQLIEAGVNLSFQCVVRSFCGLDSAAQAAGRCNRHGETACRDIYLVRCAEENLSHLPEIQTAQEAAAHVLQDYHSNSARFSGDLLSPEAIRRYYHYYFALQTPLLQWDENFRTAEGHILHENAHDPFFPEKRGNLLCCRSPRGSVD